MGNFVRTTPEEIQERLTDFFTRICPDAIYNPGLKFDTSPEVEKWGCGTLRLTVYTTGTVTQIGTELNNLKDISQLLDLEKYISENYSTIKEFSISAEEKDGISVQVRLILKQ